MRQADPPGKSDEKLKSENMQKGAVLYVYAIFGEKSGHVGIENGAMLTTYLFRYTSECTRSQIFTIFFASGSKGALTPLTKILRTFLPGTYWKWLSYLPCRHQHGSTCFDILR